MPINMASFPPSILALMDDALALRRTDLESLLQALVSSGYRLIGPQASSGIIRFTPIQSCDDLPWGISDEQAAGRYRLTEGPSTRAFFWTTGPAALKPLLFPAEEPLWRVDRDAAGRLAFSRAIPEAAPMAVIGLRGCDLAALDLHDRHFSADPWYRARREKLFVIAVNCARSAATCFCASTGDGPAVKAGYDLLLDETFDGLLLRTGSPQGERILTGMHLKPADERLVKAAAVQTTAAAASQTRALPAASPEAELAARRDSRVWETIAERCLACGNCTSVCPSCFCHRHTETPSLDAANSVHGREWDSCFSEGHSLLHGRPQRPGITHRYRQWLDHKLGSWHTQYGRSGCTGCGRCIAWCPVGIDLTESLAAVLAEEPL